MFGERLLVNTIWSHGYAVILSLLNFSLSGYMDDLTRLEKEKNVRPSPEIDAFMKVVYS